MSFAWTPLLTKRTAPSWSWASPATHDITWDIVGDTIDTGQEMLLATFKDARVTAGGRDPMGLVKHGFVRISGYLCPNLNTVARRHTRGETYALPESYDSGWDNPEQPLEEQYRSCQGTFFLVLTWKPAICILPAKIQGLVLEPTKLNLNEYRRVGAFNMDPTTRREFSKFDPHNFERQMVTII